MATCCLGVVVAVAATRVWVLQVCTLNYGCDGWTSTGCGTWAWVVASIVCHQPATTLLPYYDCKGGSTASANATSYANASVSVSSYAATPTCLVLTGAVSGPLSGGTPKAVELYAACTVHDLSAYGLGVAKNGGGSHGQGFTFPADAVAAGRFVYVSFPSDTANFEAFLGFAPDYSGTAAVNVDGDDAVELYLNGQVVDALGDAAYNGSTPVWR